MSREQLVAMARKAADHFQAATMDLEPDVYRVPVSLYDDPDRWALEMDRIFGRVPLVAAFSAQLREPGSYVSVDLGTTPVLVTRQPDGRLTAFLNSCSHRGAVVVPPGSGTARRFACPYHGWAYDAAGALVGVVDADSFGPIDRSCLGLTELPVEERCGIVWVRLTPGASLDLDTFLCGYDDVLGFLGLADCHYVAQQSLAGPNWKIAYDGYLDFYHLPVLHRATFGPDTANRALYDVWGPHQRVTAPEQFYVRLTERPSETWETKHLVGGVWTIFPHVSIASFDAAGRVWMVSVLFPGPGPKQSTTVQHFLHVREPDETVRAAVADRMAFLHRVVNDEDYFTGLNIQRSVATRFKPEVLFGRNEGGGQRFHRWVQALVDIDADSTAAADQRVDALLRAGIETVAR